jgi:hypothetical protein
MGATDGSRDIDQKPAELKEQLTQDPMLWSKYDCILIFMKDVTSVKSFV